LLEWVVLMMYHITRVKRVTMPSLIFILCCCESIWICLSFSLETQFYKITFEHIIKTLYVTFLPNGAWMHHNVTLLMQLAISWLRVFTDDWPMTHKPDILIMFSDQKPKIIIVVLHLAKTSIKFFHVGLKPVNVRRLTLLTVYENSSIAPVALLIGSRCHGSWTRMERFCIIRTSQLICYKKCNMSKTSHQTLIWICTKSPIHWLSQYLHFPLGINKVYIHLS